MKDKYLKQLIEESKAEHLEMRIKDGDEKEKQAAELIIANKELAFQNEEKDKRAAELIIANKELAFQNEEKDKRAAELNIANKELAFQNEEKEKRAAELIIANKELAFQNEEKDKRAAELIIADKELAFQSKEKEKRAAELIIANKELAFQSGEKEKRAAELIIADKELAFQSEEKEKRAAELIIANKELAFQNKEKGRRAMQNDVLKEQNIELEIQKKQLDEASQLKSAFLSNMSHELRTPLNAIVGFSELALKTSLNQKQYNYLSKIKMSSHILLGLISDILDLSKIEAGKLELEITAFNLEEVLQKAVNQVSAKSNDKGLEFMVIIDEDVPISLNGDSLRLGQVLLNLSSNAVKFTDKGKIVIQVKLLKNYGDSALLQFSVKDTGIGLTQKEIKKLFQPFTQADTSTTRKYGGSGLGLSISKKLVKMMGGHIWVDSEVGMGSTFFFTTKINIGKKELFLHYKNLADIELPKLRGIEVLLVEDNEINREVAQEILQEAGLIVTIASNGREAVEKVKNNTYDIVLMDIQMPIMDGYDATREIRKDTIYSGLPIIAMTANALLSDQEKCLEAGMDDHVAKPIDTIKLFQKIEYWIKSGKVATNEALAVNNEINLNSVGINLQTGLSRLGGNRKLYFKLLGTFYKNHKNTIKEIRLALEHGDLKEAERIVHIIKGSSGNLSAEEVYLCACVLETELKASSHEDVELRLKKLEKALEQAFASILLMEKDDEDIQSLHTGGVDIFLMKSILNKLKKLLKENNIDAVECIEEIVQDTKNTFFAEKTAEVKDYVVLYDFEGALGILNEIFYSIGEE